MGKNAHDTIIHNALIVNEDRTFRGYVCIKGEFISEVNGGDMPDGYTASAARVIDAGGKMLLPGAIDDHVHFRDPGLTEKGDMATESRAAVAGGVTSFMDMPNTKPQTVTNKDWEAKMDRAAQASVANYAFWIGATDCNFGCLESMDYTQVPGIKIFVGSSTGNMTMHDQSALKRIFSGIPDIIKAVHAEDDSIIRENARKERESNPGDIPIGRHPHIRSREACVKATEACIALAGEATSRLQVMHVSTEDELKLLTPGDEKAVTAETCVQYLWWDSDDYARLGSKIKCNPAIKDSNDREALREAVRKGLIDIIATDHAPHLPADKQGDALTAASGIPLIQFSLPMMLQLAENGIFDVPLVVEKMCHAPARIFGIDRRGFLRPGYYADLVIAGRCNDDHATVIKEEILSKCGWSPLEGEKLNWRVSSTWVNGKEVWDGCRITATCPGRPLAFRKG